MLKEIRGQINKLTSNEWTSITVAVGIIGLLLGVIGVGTVIYNPKISLLNSDINSIKYENSILKDANITCQNEINGLKNQISVTSNNQQGGITAGQLNIGQQPRHLTNDLELQIEQILTGYDKNIINLSYAAGSSEAQNFGEEIKKYLESKGFTIDLSIEMIWSEDKLDPQLAYFDKNGILNIKINAQ